MRTKSVIETITTCREIRNAFEHKTRHIVTLSYESLSIQLQITFNSK